MKTLFNYLEKYKNTPLTKDNFCEVDALIISELTYLNLEYFLVNKENGLKFTTLFSKEHENNLLRDAWVKNIDKKLLSIIYDSTRYNDIDINNYYKVEETETTTQLAIFNFHLKEHFNILSFRGTNKTLYGIIEDMKFALNDGVNSNQLASNYITKISQTNNDPIILLGHSKGGTVCETGYTLCDNNVRTSVIKIYNLDGPGVKNPYNEDLINELKIKSTKIITKKTIFGTLLNNCYPYKVVNGKSLWLLHHLVYNWEIDDKKVSTIDKVSKKSIKRNQYLMNYMNNKTDEEIKNIITDMESIMIKSDIYMFKDIRIVRLFKAYIQLLKIIFHPKKTKQTIGFFIMCMKVFL